MNESDPAGSQIYQVSRQILEAPEAISAVPTYTMDWSSWTMNLLRAFTAVNSPPKTIFDLYDFGMTVSIRMVHGQVSPVNGLNSDDKPNELPNIELVFERFQTARILSPTCRISGLHQVEHFAQNIRRDIGGPTLNGFLETW